MLTTVPGPFPFLSGGVNYLSRGQDDNSNHGFGFKIGGGLIIRKSHLAVSFEATYLHESFKPDGFTQSITGDTILIGVGFGGFLYK